MPVLESACGCCSVYVGAKVLAWIEIVFNVLRIIGALFPPEVENKVHPDGVIEEMEGYEHSLDSPLLVIPVALLGIVVGVLLLVGLEKRNKRMVMPYMVVKGIEGSLTVFAIFIFLALSVSHSAGFLVVAFIFAILLGLQIYFWFWVFSVYQQMQEVEETGAVKYVYPKMQQEQV